MASLDERPANAPAEVGRTSGRERLIVAALLLLALAIRLGGLFHDLPFSYYGDELHLMKRAMSLGAGDLNPHWFHKPAFLMYVLLFVYGLYYLAGAALGRFESVDAFAGHFLNNHGPFLLMGRVVVLLCGVAIVYFVYRIGRRLSAGREVAVCGALMAAVTPALVSTSQQIKADAPCALLMLVSLLCYLRDLDSDEGKLRWLVGAGLAAGFAMGTKYYGLVLLPSYGLWEIGRRLRGAQDNLWLVRRLFLVTGLFVIGFFVVSPYNFIDPTWAGEVKRKVATALGGGVPVFEIDASREYLPGPGAWVGAGLDFLRRLVDRSGMGLPLAALFVVGLLASLSKARAYGRWGLIVLPTAIFLGLSVVFAPYHAQSRHLAAIVPLLCLFTWPAASAVAGILTLSASRRRKLAQATVGLLAVVSLGRSVASNMDMMRLDSRTLAYRWVVENLESTDRILAEDDGPALHPNRRAIARLRRRLGSLRPGPFVVHADRRLDILEAHVSPEARNVDFLSRQWWLNQEKTDRALARSLIDSDMGSPLISRVPRPLESYRKEGIRYILSTSIGGRWLAAFEDPDVQFPSFVRFYDALAALDPVVTFDPAEWGGKGPIIWIHDLRSLSTRRNQPGERGE